MFEKVGMVRLDWNRVVGAMGLLLGLVLLFFRLDGGWFFGCVVQEVTGWSCPGCGGLRAVAAALGGDWFRSLSLNALALFRFVGEIFAGFSCFERCVWVLLVSVAAFKGFLDLFVSGCGWVRGFAEFAGLSFSVGGVAQKSFKSFHNRARTMRCTFLFGRGKEEFGFAGFGLD